MCQRRVLGLLVFVLSGSLQAESPPSAEFWHWFESYSDDHGEVFDPIALVELTLAMTTQPESVEEEVNPDEKSDDSHCGTALQSATCRSRKD